MEAYKVLNIDKYTGKIVTNKQIIEKKEMTEDTFKEKLGLYFEELYKDAREILGEEFYNEQYERTVADENCDVNNLMYLNENNEICMI